MLSNGEDYRGHTTTTERGYTCMTWPEGIVQESPTYSGLEGNNYCRNPDQDSKPWCYTVEGGFTSNVAGLTWDWCEVVEAQDSCVGKFGKN